MAYIGSLKQNLEATLGLVITFGGKGKPEPAPAPVPAPKPKPEPKKKVEPASTVLDDVHFDFDKARLTDAAKAVLAKNIVVIKANPGIAIRIVGNTCPHGADDNMRLDKRRASVVKEYLAKEVKSKSRG